MIIGERTVLQVEMTNKYHNRFGILSDRKVKDGSRVVKIVSFEEVSPEVISGIIKGLPSNVRVARSKGWSSLFSRVYYMQTVIWKDENGTRSELNLPENTITVKKYLKLMGGLDCLDKKK